MRRQATDAGEAAGPNGAEQAARAELARRQEELETELAASKAALLAAEAAQATTSFNSAPGGTAAEYEAGLRVAAEKVGRMQTDLLEAGDTVRRHEAQSEMLLGQLREAEGARAREAEELQRTQLLLRAEQAKLEAQRSLLEEAGPSLRSADELRHLRARLAERDAVVESHSSALREERKRSLWLQRSLDDAQAGGAQGHAMTRSRKKVSVIEDLEAGGAPSPVEDASLALGLGSSPPDAATLDDIGLGEVQVLRKVDRGLRHITVLMAWRSDLRLLGYGLWLFCHVVYALTVLFRVFISSHRCLLF